MRTWASRLLAASFLALVGLPLAANMAGIDGADQAAENRELAPFPELRAEWSSMIEYPAAFAAWFGDHFGFRARLVRWYGESRLFLHVSPSPTVGLGKNGWLFYLDDFGLDDYARTRPMTTEQVHLWRDAVLKARDWVHARGGAYVFTIAPDKHVIYPEAFPSGVKRVNRVSRTDQVMDALAASGVAVDLRPALLEARRRERLYQLTDTHWNDRGAFLAYQLIIDKIRAQKPTIPPPWQRSDFIERTERVPAMDLGGMIGLTRVLTEDDLELVPRRPRRAHVVEPPGAEPTSEEGELITEIPGSSLPRAVIFRDSFASRLIPFLSEHFSRAVYLWQDDFLPANVEREHADVVLEEIVGRHLYSFVPSPELVP